MNEFVVVGTTAKAKGKKLKLPNKKIFNTTSENFLISNKKDLMELLKSVDYKDKKFILDCESKQAISLYDEANISNKIDYKPNDLTMEAADLTILNYFDRAVNGKSIAIYGTGNIAFKLALRLSERNANIYIYGRKNKKVTMCIDAIKQITFDSKLVHYGNMDSKVDCLVSCVNADEVIGTDFFKNLNPNSLCLDVGIGNFSKKFIKVSLESGHEVRRLDVRQSQEIMDGYINSRINSEFRNIIGRDIINKCPIVAGGIIGDDGEIIVDRIKNPTKVIGIANGIGGVKNESEINNEEKNKIKKIQLYIKQSV